jgi:prepilin-type processing-associated H-X9-DG protein
MSEHSDEQPMKRRGCWWVALPVLAVLAVGSYYVIAKISEAANRMHCANQLQQFAMAMHNYTTAYHSFPPAFIADRDGRPLLSWRVLLLEFLDNETYKKIRLNEPWDSPHNRDVFQKADLPQRNFHCCSATNPEDETCYVMVVGPNTISDGPHSVRFGDIKDGTPNTILFVEVKNSGIHWAEPRDLDFGGMSFRINDPSRKGVSSYHPGLAGVVFADCHVQFIEDGVDPKLVKALMTINGGEDVSSIADQHK